MEKGRGVPSPGVSLEATEVRQVADCGSVMGLKRQGKGTRKS